MKPFFAASTLGTGLLLASLTPLLASAQNAPGPEMGRVVSSIAVLQQVAVPRQICTNEPVTVPGQKSGAGAVMGGLAGGAMGNAVGDGAGRAVATMIGIVGGAMLGNNIEGGAPPQTQMVQRCHTQNVVETQTVGYNVTYEYAGKQYTVQMPQDPGPWVRLQVTPMTAPPSQYQQPPTQYPPPQVYGPQSALPYGSYGSAAPTVTYVAPGRAVISQETTYVWPATRPVYAQPSVNLWVGSQPAYTYRGHDHGRSGADLRFVQRGRDDDRWDHDRGDRWERGR